MAMVEDLLHDVLKSSVQRRRKPASMSEFSNTQSSAKHINKTIRISKIGIIAKILTCRQFRICKLKIRQQTRIISIYMIFRAFRAFAIQLSKRLE